VASSTVARAAEREERAAEASTLRTLVATNCLVVQFLVRHWPGGPGVRVVETVGGEGLPHLLGGLAGLLDPSRSRAAPPVDWGSPGSADAWRGGRRGRTEEGGNTSGGVRGGSFPLPSPRRGRGAGPDGPGAGGGAPTGREGQAASPDGGPRVSTGEDGAAASPSGREGGAGAGGSADEPPLPLPPRGGRGGGRGQGRGGHGGRGGMLPARGAPPTRGQRHGAPSLATLPVPRLVGERGAAASPTHGGSRPAATGGRRLPAPALPSPRPARVGSTGPQRAGPERREAVEAGGGGGPDLGVGDGTQPAGAPPPPEGPAALAPLPAQHVRGAAERSAAERSLPCSGEAEASGGVSGDGDAACEPEGPARPPPPPLQLRGAVAGGGPRHPFGDVSLALPPSRSGGGEASGVGADVRLDPHVGAGAAAPSDGRGGGGGGGGGGGAGEGASAGGRLRQPAPPTPPADADPVSLTARREAALAAETAAHEAYRWAWRKSTRGRWDPASETACQAAKERLAGCQGALRGIDADIASVAAGRERESHAAAIGAGISAAAAPAAAAAATAAARPRSRTTANSTVGRTAPALSGPAGERPASPLGASQGLVWRPVVRRQVAFRPLARAVAHDEASASLSGSDASDTDVAVATGPLLPAASTAGPGLVARPTAPRCAPPAPLPPPPRSSGRPSAPPAALPLPPTQAAPADDTASGRPPSLLDVHPSSRPRSARPPH